ncbi:hypothetical protein ACLOJK_000862 [Asimina triloba]
MILKKPGRQIKKMVAYTCLRLLDILSRQALQCMERRKGRDFVLVRVTLAPLLLYCAHDTASRPLHDLKSERKFCREARVCREVRPYGYAETADETKGNSAEKKRCTNPEIRNSAGKQTMKDLWTLVRRVLKKIWSWKE